jgi:hypothetical protein
MCAAHCRADDPTAWISRRVALTEEIAFRVPNRRGREGSLNADM